MNKEKGTAAPVEPHAELPLEPPAPTSPDPEQEPEQDGPAAAAPAAVEEPEEGKQPFRLEQEFFSKAVTPVERFNAYQVLDRFRQTQMVMAAAKQLANISWGKNLSVAAQAAVARYAMEIGADPARHIYVLGGNIFINGTYYRDVISANPKFKEALPPEWLHYDPRLDNCALCDEPFNADFAHGHDLEFVTAENRRRLEEKVQRARARLDENLDEEAPSLCRLTLVYSDGRGPFKGIGRVRGGKTTKTGQGGKQYEVFKDPVGMEFPRETAETRAWREAGEKAEPVWFRQHPALKAAEQLIVEGRTIESLPPGPPPTAPMDLEP